jgi:hypothetical protein
MNIKLILNILSSVNGGLITSAALFNPLVGQSNALLIISGLGICQVIVSAVNSNLSTQANTVMEVANIKGMEPLRVNAEAGPSLAALAVDPSQPKIGGASPAIQATLQNIAKGA